MRRTADQRFWRKVTKAGNNECWPWKASIISSGYGCFSLNGRTQPAHRAAWILINGPVPSGLFICHTCDNKLCCNPRHLYAGTVSENTKDAVVRGQHSPSRKFTIHELSELHDRFVAHPELKQCDVAREIGISESYLSHIVRALPHPRLKWRFLGKLLPRVSA